jgi:hypothetical protein
MTEVNQLEERYGAASNAEAICRILAKAVSDIVFRFCLSETHEPIFLTKYSSEWRNRYPVSILGGNRRLPFKWGCGRFPAVATY